MFRRLSNPPPDPSGGFIQRRARYFVEQMRDGARDIIDNRSPDYRGRVKDWLKEPGVVIPLATGDYVAYLGYLPSLDIHRRPRNTIRQFLIWYRGAHGGGRVPGRRQVKPWKLAWYFLAPAEKDALEQARLAGQFGGPLPPPKYLEAVNAGKKPGGNAYVGFVDRIKNDVRLWRVQVARDMQRVP